MDPGRFIQRESDLVELILAVPGMTDPQFRHLLFGALPSEIDQQLQRHPSPRAEVAAMIDVFADNSRLRPWDELVKAMRAFLPGSEAVARLESALIAAGLVKRA